MLVKGYTDEEVEKAYVKYLNYVLEDEGFDKKMTEGFSDWLEVEKEAKTWLESL